MRIGGESSLEYGRRGVRGHTRSGRKGRGQKEKEGRTGEGRYEEG